MNEKIKELAEQAGIATYYPAGIAERLEKFAQLIVRECVDIADETALGETTYGWMVGNKIKKHFGVEE